jgi:hypothetical protein
LLDIVGDVLGDVFDTTRAYDWISLDTGSGSANATGAPGVLSHIKSVTAHGSCDIGALAHYFSGAVPDTVGEYNIHRNGGTFRIDHSMFLRYALTGLPSDALDAAKRIGFVKEDFVTRLFEAHDKQLILLGFAADRIYSLYRHRASGLTVPYFLPGASNVAIDLRKVAAADLPTSPHLGWLPDAHTFMRDEFDYLGPITEDAFKENLRLIVGNLPGNSKVFIIEMNEKRWDTSTGQLLSIDRFAELNKWVRSAFVGFPNVTFLNPESFSEAPAEQLDSLHFSRKVYFKMYRKILEIAESDQPDDTKLAV